MMQRLRYILTILLAAGLCGCPGNKDRWGSERAVPPTKPSAIATGEGPAPVESVTWGRSAQPAETATQPAETAPVAVKPVEVPAAQTKPAVEKSPLVAEKPARPDEVIDITAIASREPATAPAPATQPAKMTPVAVKPVEAPAAKARPAVEVPQPVVEKRARPDEVIDITAIASLEPATSPAPATQPAKMTPVAVKPVEAPAAKARPAVEIPQPVAEGPARPDEVIDITAIVPLEPAISPAPATQPAKTTPVAVKPAEAPHPATAKPEKAAAAPRIPAKPVEAPVAKVEAATQPSSPVAKVEIATQPAQPVAKPEKAAVAPPTPATPVEAPVAKIETATQPSSPVAKVEVEPQPATPATEEPVRPKVVVDITAARPRPTTLPAKPTPSAAKSKNAPGAPSAVSGTPPDKKPPSPASATKTKPASADRTAPLERPMELTELLAGPTEGPAPEQPATQLPPAETPKPPAPGTSSEKPAYQYPAPRPGTELAPIEAPRPTSAPAESTQTTPAVPTPFLLDPVLAPLGAPPLPSEAPRPVPRPKPAPKPAPRPAPKPTTAPAVKPSPVPRPVPPPPPKPIVFGQPEIVATSGLMVDGKIVTSDEILRGAASPLTALSTAQGQESFRKNVEGIVQQEIYRQRDRLLTLAEAKRRLTEEQGKQVDAQVQQIVEAMVAEAGGSRTRLQEQLRGDGLTLEEFQSQQRDALVVQMYLRTMLMPAISVNRQMLLDYYRRHVGRYTQPGKVQMRLIAIPFEAFYPEDVFRPTATELATAKAEAKAAIGQAAAALARGEDFGDVARRLSRDAKAGSGGLWPAMPRGSFRETKVEDAAFSLVEGQVSGALETDSGYYIVKTQKVVPGERVSFEDAQKDIEQALREEQFAKLADEYYKRIRGNATVDVSKTFVDVTVAKAMEQYWRP